MKSIYLTVIIAVTFIASLFAQAQTTSFDVNGVKVIFKPTTKSTISVRVYFRGGVTNYPQNKAGIERMALGAADQCGTSKYSANEFKDIKDNYGITISNSAEYDYSDFEMDCVSKYFDQGWDLLSEAINNPVFNEQELQLLRNKIIAGIKTGQANPDERLKQLTIKNAFEGTPYATDPDGTEETILALTADDIKSYYYNLLNKNKMFIVIAGNITKDEITKKVSAAFTGLPLKPFNAVTLTAPVWNDNKTLTEQRNMATNYMNAFFNAPLMTSPDYIPYTLGISAFSGTLFSELRTKRNLSYAPGAHTIKCLMPYAVMYISTTKPAEATEIMVNQLNRIKTLSLSNTGLERIKNHYITNNYMDLQSSSAITSNLGIAEIMGGWYYFENAPAMLEQVTPEQIQDALKKYIVGIRWSYLGNADRAKEADGAFNMRIK